MISVKNIEKSYQEARAVSGLSFEVERGEIVGLLGHNGAGKTTMMKIITGFLEPTAGTVSVAGFDVLEQRQEVQRLIGYLPENAPLYPEMSVEDYLLFIAELRAIPRAARKSAIDDALDATGLRSRRRQVIQTLSKGYRQRVGLAQAILHKPAILILDEPTNGLDPVQIVEIRSLIKRLAEDTTIILSTHILSEIEAVCDRVLILIDGQLTKDATLQSLLSSSTVTVQSRGCDDVAGALRSVEGVKRIDLDGEADEAGYQRYLIRCADGESPTPAITKALVEAGAEVAEVSVDRQSLEQVFRTLMANHVASAKQEESA
ncbi:MAG: ABC transporter ATP-binding protein [Myxococcota bacterium]|nr:ABC transporter ATP-binding protein [Myxococcota bacterium]